MIRTTYLMATILFGLLAAGCERGKAPDAGPMPDAAPAAPAPTPATVAPPTPSPPPVAPAAAPAAEDPAATFDKGAFAGVFSGGGVRLELHGDGTYGMEGRGSASQGSWTHEATSGVIRLDPGSKGADDQVLQADGKDRLVPLDAAGRAALGQSALQRQQSD